MARFPAVLRPVGGQLGQQARQKSAQEYLEQVIHHPLLEVGSGVAWFALAGAAVGALVLAALPALASTAASIGVPLLTTLSLAAMTFPLSFAAGWVVAIAAMTAPQPLRRIAQQSLRLGALMPSYVLALAWVAALGVPADPSAGVLAVIAVQSLAGASIVARATLASTNGYSRTVDEVAADLGASRMLRFRSIHWPAWLAAGRSAVAAVALMVLADFITPTLLSPETPTIATSMWRAAAGGESGSAAVFALLVAAMAVPLIAYYKRAPLAEEPLRRHVGLTPPVGSFLSPTAGLIGALLAIVPIAGLVALGAKAVGATEPLHVLQGFGLAFVGAYVGSIAAGFAATSLIARRYRTALNGARWLAALPGAAIGLGVVLAFGGLASTGTSGEILLYSLIGGVASFGGAVTAIAKTPRPSRRLSEAISDLGGSVEETRRRWLFGAFDIAVLRSGVSALLSTGPVFVVVAGVTHPLATALGAADADLLPAASLVGLLFGSVSLFAAYLQSEGQR